MIKGHCFTGCRPGVDEGDAPKANRGSNKTRVFLFDFRAFH